MDVSGERSHASASTGGSAPEEESERPRRSGKCHRPQCGDPDEGVEVHLQCKEWNEQSVGNEEHPHDSPQPMAAEHQRGKERCNAHEAVTEDVDSVQERIERL